MELTLKNKHELTHAQMFELFYNNFRENSLEWALGCFKWQPVTKKYVPCGSVQHVEITWEDGSIYNAIEKIGRD